MQTPVRFYITQSDDQPVVRQIPVPPRASASDAVEAKPANQVGGTRPAPSVGGRVKSLIARRSDVAGR